MCHCGLGHLCPGMAIAGKPAVAVKSHESLRSPGPLATQQNHRHLLDGG